MVQSPSATPCTSSGKSKPQARYWKTPLTLKADSRVTSPITGFISSSKKSNSGFTWLVQNDVQRIFRISGHVSSGFIKSFRSTPPLPPTNNQLRRQAPWLNLLFMPALPIRRAPLKSTPPSQQARYMPPYRIEFLLLRPDDV